MLISMHITVHFFTKNLIINGICYLYSEQKKILKRMQMFCKRTKFFGECNSFARERKCFASKHNGFWGM